VAEPTTGTGTGKWHRVLAEVSEWGSE